MTHPASIAQLTNNPSPFPGSYHLDLFDLLFYLLFLACIILAVKIWSRNSDAGADASAGPASIQSAQQPRQSDSAYPPGMQIDMVLKELNEKKGAPGGESAGGRGMADGRKGVKCVIKI